VLSVGGKRRIHRGCPGVAAVVGSHEPDVGIGPISEAVNMYAVALRARRRLLYDAENQKVTSSTEANKYLARIPQGI